jgi:hypothetical protein
VGVRIGVAGENTWMAREKRQLATNTAMAKWIMQNLQTTRNIFKRNKVRQLFPHLQPSPFLLHTFDLAHNNWNPDIMLDKLPHQLSRAKLLALKKKKRQFLQTFTEQLTPAELSRKFADAHDLVLFDDDLHFLDDLDDLDSEPNDNSNKKSKKHSSSDGDSADDSSDDDDSDYSSSGDDDSSDSEEEKNSKFNPPTCAFGHSLYTSVCPVPPLFHISPEDDPFLRNYGISLHSTRLFLTGCQHGHIVLHDALSGFNKVIGSSKFPIVQLSLLPIHQHYSELEPQQLQKILNISEAYKVLQSQRRDQISPIVPKVLQPPPPTTETTTTTNNNSTTKSNSPQPALHDITAEAMYHPDTRVVPLVVALDQCGTVTIWDSTTSKLIALYTQIRTEMDENGVPQPTPQTLNMSNMYNITGVLKMSMCAVPLLPQCQRAERFGPPKQPSKSIYATYNSSVLAMIFNKYQTLGLDPKTGLPFKSGPQLSPHNLNQPHYDLTTIPWCPFLNFPFHFATPKLNSGCLIQFHTPSDSKTYIAPFVDPVTKQPLRELNTTQSSALDLVTPNRGTFAAPTILVTPYRNGQLTFCDLRNVSTPTFYTFAHKQHTTCIAYIGGLLWTAGWDCVIKSWDLRYLSTPVHTIQCAQKHITAMTGLDDKYIIIATAEKQIKIFDIEKLAINRTYAVHVISDCEEYIKTVDFSRYKSLVDQNDVKIARLQDAVIAYEDDYRKKSNQKSTNNDDIDEIDDENSNNINNNQQQQNQLSFSDLYRIYEVLQTPMEERPSSIKDLLNPDPFESSPYTMLSIYPNLIHTSIFHQWLQQHQLTYISNRFYPLMTSYDVETNCLITNVLTFGKNNNEIVPTARNATQRSEHALNACLFDWDFEEIVQNIITVDGVILTAAKECKSKVGLNGLSGSITPWVTSIDINSGDVTY